VLRWFARHPRFARHADLVLVAECGRDLGRCLAPALALRAGVVLGDVAMDRGLEVDHRAEGSALEPAPGERREEDGAE
jgi:hypothetical protein